MDALSGFRHGATPQNKPIAPQQVRNHAGGYVYEVTPAKRVWRFLILGTEGGTYYATEAEHTRENAAFVAEYAERHPRELLAMVEEVSVGGRAHRNNPALFALAALLAVGGTEIREDVITALPKVARTGTHLTQFVAYALLFRSWGRGMRRAVGRWYSDQEVQQVERQVVKYRSRNGWNHADLLRQAHPGLGAESSAAARSALYDWILDSAARGNAKSPRGGHPVNFGKLQAAGLRLTIGYELAKPAPVRRLPGLIREYGLSWEMLPTEALNSTEVWTALLERGVPQTALMRQLSRLTRLGMLNPMTDTLAGVVTQLTDAEKLIAARVHPVAALIALRTYASGRSLKGESTWTPVPQVVDALDQAFYASFKAVAPSNKRIYLGVDVSGSMATAISGLPISCRDGAAAMALVTAATEPRHAIFGFTGEMTPLNISSRQRLDDVVRTMSRLPFGRTDCSAPMRHALKTGMEVDQFVILTDNETWYGNQHPMEALREYRQRTGIPAKLVVVAMTATPFSIADPADAGTLDVVGFDAATPAMISEFAKG